MPYNKYQISDIHIGDEVYFDSTDDQHNYNEYWIVKSVDLDKSELYINTPASAPHTKYHTVHISDVRARLPVTKKKVYSAQSFEAAAGIARKAS